MHWAKKIRQAVDSSYAVPKVVLFARTDPGVARLAPGDGAFLSLVRAGVAEAAAAAGLAGGESVPASAVSVLQLRSFRSSEDVASRVASFMSSSAPCTSVRVLLVVGDSTEVSASQVTCARQQVRARKLRAGCVLSLPCRRWNRSTHPSPSGVLTCEPAPLKRSLRRPHSCLSYCTAHPRL